MTDSVSLVPSPLKAALRAEALARRDALELDDRLLWDEAIVERVLALPVFVLEHFQQKCEAVLRPELRQNKRLELWRRTLFAGKATAD